MNELVVLRDSLKVPPALKPPVKPSHFEYKNLRGGDFWRRIPEYQNVDEKTFLNYRWQTKKTIHSAERLLDAVKDLAPPGFIEDCKRGFEQAPMSVRVSPYLLSLIDWANPMDDPLRIQFIPVGSRFLPDHPQLGLVINDLTESLAATLQERARKQRAKENRRKRIE